MTGLYLHIPFCVRKCIYCDFYSIETLEGSIPERLRAPLPNHGDFLDALEEELRGLPDGFAPQTVFIGGGTPTELSDDDLARLLAMIPRYAQLDGLIEWTCESNPGTLTANKARLLKEAGVNRVSMGVQSFEPHLLEFLGRIHGPDDVPEGVALLREAGFTEINLDLIYGVPGSDMASTRSDIEKLIALQPQHASCYCLTFEEGTPLMDMNKKGYVAEVDGEIEREQYQLIRSALRQAGYDQYEISNFALPGHACRHNLLYWGPGTYIGCGPSAHSHWAGRRYSNVRHLRKYTRLLLSGESPVDYQEQLPPEAKAREILVMWLRRLDGVPRNEFLAATGFDYTTLCGETIESMKGLGLLTDDHDRLRLTEDGLFVSDRIFSELV